MAAICGIIISLMVFGGTNYHSASINSDTNMGQNAIRVDSRPNAPTLANYASNKEKLELIKIYTCDLYKGFFHLYYKNENDGAYKYEYTIEYNKTTIFYNFIKSIIAGMGAYYFTEYINSHSSDPNNKYDKLIDDEKYNDIILDTNSDYNSDYKFTSPKGALSNYLHFK